jgi:hypothetical protein
MLHICTFLECMSGMHGLHDVYHWDYNHGLKDVHVIRYYSVPGFHEAFPVTYLSISIRVIPICSWPTRHACSP